jgi:hypothetical protein
MQQNQHIMLGLIGRSLVFKEVESSLKADGSILNMPRSRASQNLGFGERPPFVN